MARHSMLIGTGALAFLVTLGLTPETSARTLPPLNLDLRATEEQVAPGLVHIHLASDSSDAGLPLSVHILRADLDSVLCRFVIAKGQIQGQETTSQMARRHGALAGVNGGFFASHDPGSDAYGDFTGFCVLNGKVLSEAGGVRSSFGMRNEPQGRQVPFVAWPLLRAQLLVDGKESLDLSRINGHRGDGEVVLYTPEWGRVTLTGQTGTEVVVRNGRVTDVRRLRGSSPIPEDGYVLSASPPADVSLEKAVSKATTIATRITLTARKPEGQTLPLENCCYVTAGPALLVDGKAITDYAEEGFGERYERYIHGRHPRTAVGFPADGKGLILVVVDGRQPGLSSGVTLPELTDLMQSQGAHEAYNLDGGGSSTMVVGGETLNSPSDGRERLCSDALLLFPRDPE